MHIFYPSPLEIPTRVLDFWSDLIFRGCGLYTPTLQYNVNNFFCIFVFCFCFVVWPKKKLCDEEKKVAQILYNRTSKYCKII